MKENEFPCFYVDSDNASRSFQNTYKLLIWLGLFLMFVATLIESIEIFKMIKQYTGYVIFVSSIMTILITILKPEKGWYKGRAIAESIKTLSWRYMMKVEPFNQNDPNQNFQEFTNRLTLINAEANQDGFIPKPNKHHREVITLKMETIRNKNLLERKDFYKTNRIEDQIKWYEKKSETNKYIGLICSWLIIICQIIAGIYLVRNNEVNNSINLNVIMVFIATSLIAVIELYKFKDLHQAYALTYQELKIIRARFGIIQDESSFNEFVLDAEQAISREHTMWLARRGE